MTHPRRWLLAALAPAILLLGSSAAFAAEREGRIDQVDSSDGQVQVLYSLPDLPAAESPDLGSVAVTVEGKAVDAKAELAATSTEEVRRTTVLALDVSRSMTGEKFAAAKTSALAFIDGAPDDVYIGLVTFASTVDSVAAPTQDRASLREDIESLDLTLQTRLYDGVVQAVEVAGAEGARSVLLLSDGNDTTSQATLKDVLADLEEGEVRVDAIALDQAVPDDSPLHQIATASGGDVRQVNNASDLEALFAAQASVLSKQVLIGFPRPAGINGDATITVSINSGADTYTDKALVSLKSDGDAGSAAPLPASDGLVLSSTWLLAGIAMLFVGFGALLAVGAMNAGKAELTPMQRQLQLYTVHGMDTHKASRHSADGSSIKDSAVAVADRFVKGQDFEEKLATKLDRAGFKLTASEWILLHIGIALLAPVVGFVLTGGSILVTLISFLVGAAGPWLYLSFKESRRIKAFNAQLASTLQIIAGALQAGLSLPQAVDTVVQEGAEPVASEFRRAIIEQRLGVEIEDTLDTVAERMQSQDFKWVVMAVRIQREVGGNLAELLLTVSATLREREYLRRQVQVLSAEGRLSAWILGGLPVFFFGYLALMRPEYLEPMLTNQLGWIMLGTAVVMMIVGAFWLKKTVKVEV